MTPIVPLPDSLDLLLRTLEIQQLASPEQKARAQALLEKHHYLGGIQAVGEQMHYAVADAQGEWVAVAIFAAAAKHLRPRDQWIGWTQEQCRRRRALVANNVRLLLVPERNVPNLGTAAMRRVLARLSDDWQTRYGHPILIVETFVDPERFQGTLYKAGGWSELGLTKGHGRCRRDYYENHGQPKCLFVRELAPNARRTLQAEHLKPALAHVEAKVPPRTTLTAPELASLSELFRQVPDYHQRCGRYPLCALLGITAAAYLADCPRGQKDLVGFARRLSPAQRRTLGVRANNNGDHPAPSQSTFSRMFAHVPTAKLEAMLRAHQRQVRGEPDDDLVVLDGKEPKHSGGQNVVSAITAPKLHFLGATVVAEKTNEIPAARELFEKIDVDGKLVSLDALHTQVQTAREVVRDHGGDYLLTVKGNQPTLKAVVQAHVPDPGSPLLTPGKTPRPCAGRVWKRASS